MPAEAHLAHDQVNGHDKRTYGTNNLVTIMVDDNNEQQVNQSERYSTTLQMIQKNAHRHDAQYYCQTQVDIDQEVKTSYTQYVYRPRLKLGHDGDHTAMEHDQNYNIHHQISTTKH